jgi:hypothetical protein
MARVKCGAGAAPREKVLRDQVAGNRVYRRFAPEFTTGISEDGRQ